MAESPGSRAPLEPAQQLSSPCLSGPHGHLPCPTTLGLLDENHPCDSGPAVHGVLPLEEGPPREAGHGGLGWHLPSPPHPLPVGDGDQLRAVVSAQAPSLAVGHPVLTQPVAGRAVPCPTLTRDSGQKGGVGLGAQKGRGAWSAPQPLPTSCRPREAPQGHRPGGPRRYSVSRCRKRPIRPPHPLKQESPAVGETGAPQLEGLLGCGRMIADSGTGGAPAWGGWGLRPHRQVPQIQQAAPHRPLSLGPL